MSDWQTYRVRPGYEVRLGPGSVFQAEPATVAGALNAGAVEPVELVAEPEPARATQDQPEGDE